MTGRTMAVLLFIFYLTRATIFTFWKFGIVADFIVEDVKQKVESVEGVASAQINLVFEPEWNKDMMSEEAKLELGFL